MFFSGLEMRAGTVVALGDRASISRQPNFSLGNLA